VSQLFAREAVSESVATRMHFDAWPEAVWEGLVLYEEIPGHPPLLLRAFLPHPLRTEGDKTRIGELVRCTYSEGILVKRITAVEPPYLLRFDVVEQNLGIEGCVLTKGGSYRSSPCEGGTDVTLVTHYLAYLRPRRLWRPLEAMLVRRLHRHILSAVRAALLPAGSVARAASSLSRPCSHR
jgi:hypothetical protein